MAICKRGISSLNNSSQIKTKHQKPFQVFIMYQAWAIQDYILFSSCPHTTDNPREMQKQRQLTMFALRLPKESLGRMKSHKN